MYSGNNPSNEKKINKAQGTRKKKKGLKFKSELSKDPTPRGRLNESGEIIKVLLNASSESALLVKIDGTVLALNKTAAIRLGHKTSELVGKNVFSFFSAAVSKHRKRKMNQLLKEGRPIQFEDQRNGRWFSNSLYPVRVRNGKIAQLAVFGRDITNQKLNESALKSKRDDLERKVSERTKKLVLLNKALQKEVNNHKQTDSILKTSEKKYSTLVEKGNDGIVIIQDGILKFTNSTISRITGFEKKKVVDKPFLNFVAPNYRKLVVERYKKRMQGKKVPNNYEIEILSKTGQNIPVEVNASLIFHEGKLADMAIIRDISYRKKTEKKLALSSEKYTMLVERSNDGIGIAQDGRIVFSNPTLSKLTGYSTKELFGMPFKDIIVPKYRKEAFARYSMRLKGDKVPSRFELGLLTKKGSTIIVETSASLIMHEGRQASMAMVRDISDRKKVEAILEEERNKLRSIYKSTGEGLALYDSEGKVVYMNPALKKLFVVRRNLIGVRRDEIVKNRNKYFKYHLERYDDSLETQKKAYAGKIVSNVMMKLHTKIPKYIEGNYVPIKDNSLKTVGMSASFRDVTLLKSQSEKIQKQLVEVETQKKRMQAIFKSIEDGSFIFDKNLRIIQANSACELFTGKMEKDILGKKYFEVFGCHDKIGHNYPEFNPVSKVLATNEPVPYDEHLHKNSAGKDRWVGVSYTPIFNQNRKIDQIVAVIRDITALKELDQAKSGFVSLASHELRTPLTVINGYLSLLLNGDLGSLDSEKTRGNFITVLNKVQNETGRLTRLVGELLNVSRIEEGRLKLSLRKINPNLVIKEVNEELRPYGAMKGVRMLTRMTENNGSKQPLVLADRGRLKEIMINLLENSIKFTEGGDKITTTCFSRNGKIIIEVEDTGVGIAKSMQPRIFDKFQQVPGSYLKENKGTGLGLFIVKSLVKLHKGDISVDSKKDKGTTFSFYLPKVAA